MVQKGVKCALTRMREGYPQILLWRCCKKSVHLCVWKTKKSMWQISSAGNASLCSKRNAIKIKISCPERLWDPLTWRHSKSTCMYSHLTYTKWSCSIRGVELHDLPKSFLTLTFCDSVTTATKSYVHHFQNLHWLYKIIKSTKLRRCCSCSFLYSLTFKHV